MNAPAEDHPRAEHAFLETYDAGEYERPSVTVDVVVLTAEAGALHAVVVPRSEQPEVAAAANASAEAMRGIVQSVSREVDPAVLRVNLVIGEENGEEDVLRCVRFLCSASGGFFIGSTVDVR